MHIHYFYVIVSSAIGYASIPIQMQKGKGDLLLESFVCLFVCSLVRTPIILPPLILLGFKIQTQNPQTRVKRT